MTMLPIAVGSAIWLLLAYRVYGNFLSRKFALSDQNSVPAVDQRDDNDFVPTPKGMLLGQHFSAIAAAGPIVGPILAGVAFGWAPALAWILIGSVFLGGVHDFAALVASIRHRAQSIAEIVRRYMTRRSYLLFLGFIWLALVYIIVAFTDITAQSFVGNQTLDNGQVVTGAGIATSSLLYLLLPVAMGLLLRFTKITVGWATVLFVPLVIGAVWIGQFIPLDLGPIVGGAANAHKAWDVIILVYCMAAAAIPVWLLLQPRGLLGGVFLYLFLLVGVGGALFSGAPVQYPAFTGWTAANGDLLAPMLFITIACGAVSGFHSLIASGTTSKQLARETDAKPIGYGTMLLEAGVAVLALGCVMMLVKGSPVAGQSPNMIFATGIGGFLGQIGVPPVLAVSLMLMAFTTFVYDTLDVTTRLGRYIVQEVTGWRDRRGLILGTVLTGGTPLLFVMQQATDAAGKPIPAWRVFWPLFGASNQLLAALTLLGITVWLWRSQRAKWALVVAGVPCVFMYIMSCWALVSILTKSLASGTVTPVLAIAAILILLAAWMFAEAVACFRRPVPMPATS